MSKKALSFILISFVLFFSIGIIFTPTFFAHKVSRISIDKEINLPLILNSKKELTLLFFGYSGCTDICAPRLQSLSKFYSSLDTRYKNQITIEFIDISVPIDKELPQKFAKYFHSDFKGTYLSNNILRDYTRAFSVYFSQSLFDKTEYDHTTHLYLLQKKQNIKKLKYIYNAYPFDYKQITLDIKGLLDE